MESVKALMAGLIDYAGLFPPAGLGMREAVKNYAAYLSGPDEESLGAFVLPAERLPELEAELAALEARAPSPWKLSVIVKESAGKAVADASGINASAKTRGYRIDAVELAPGLFSELKSSAAPSRADSAAPQVYAELSSADDLERLLPEMKRAGVRAKIRTGGITAAAIPTTAQILRCLRACCSAGVGFKATAGLHHPIRAQHPLTYEANSARAQMYGFLNVFVAAAFIWNGTDDVTASRILNENVPDSFSFADDAIGWLDLHLSVNRIVAAREQFAHSFGSCSFREPVDELAILLSAASAR